MVYALVVRVRHSMPDVPLFGDNLQPAALERRDSNDDIVNRHPHGHPV